MLSWLSNNAVTIIAAAVVFFIAVLAVLALIRDRRKGPSSCGGNCANCPMGSSCHKK